MEYSVIICVIYFCALVFGGLALWYQGNAKVSGLSAPVIKCKKTPRKKCSFVAEEAKKR